MSKEFIKSELLLLVEEFEKQIKSSGLIEPYLSYDAEGVLTPEEAKNLIIHGHIPKIGLVICSKRQNEDYWDSIFIEKIHDEESYIYLITTRDMGIEEELANNEYYAIKFACEILLKYVSL